MSVSQKYENLDNQQKIHLLYKASGDLQKEINKLLNNISGRNCK